ncbi:hypothetical protein HPB49_004682 [Dermacentor silvarum]|uniref:Uncharacterized protein n=1 Tax=Dermacentor silvarum TaxID=543639 RepID=A0ACB8D320_DERSI|nr:hypothetical protein HPB49_004682 [Dermacentor silvarum]
MGKGIIRNIPLNYTQDQLVHALVNARKPSLAYAKRLGSTTTMMLLYEGNRAWAHFTSIMMRVSLDRKQTFAKRAAGSGIDPMCAPDRMTRCARRAVPETRPKTTNAHPNTSSAESCTPRWTGLAGLNSRRRTW